MACQTGGGGACARVGGVSHVGGVVVVVVVIVVIVVVAGDTFAVQELVAEREKKVCVYAGLLSTRAGVR